MLIAGRAVMGLGAAASEPGTLSMLRHLYAGERERTRAIGMRAGVSGLALALGPVIGGTLVGVWDWRGDLLVQPRLRPGRARRRGGRAPRERRPQAQRVDTAGTLLAAASLAALVFAVISGETAGFGSPEVIVLFCVSAAAAAGFGWRERRAPHPLLDPRYLRLPAFTVPNIVAFSLLRHVRDLLLHRPVPGRGGRLLRLPHRADLRAHDYAGDHRLAARRPVDQRGRAAGLDRAGCLIFGAGLLVTNAVLSPHPAYLPRAAALALTGIGIGATVVPITSWVLTAVPPEHSGMAASATNTSREIGAVTGMAILGALVKAQLRADLTGRLHQLGIPPNFQAIVINALETGTVPCSNKSAPQPGKLVQEVIQAAYHAFQTSLHTALYLCAGLVIGAGLVTAATLRRRT